MERQLTSLFESADQDGDGRLNAHEFSAMVSATAVGRGEPG
jgi:Ca2+-binding EF-hand superfamily protein